MKRHQIGESRISSNEVDLALMSNDIATIKNDVKEMKISLKSDFVELREFNDLKDRVNTLDTRFWAVIILAITSLLGTVTTLLVTLLKG